MGIFLSVFSAHNEGNSKGLFKMKLQVVSYTGLYAITVSVLFFKNMFNRLKMNLIGSAGTDHDVHHMDVQVCSRLGAEQGSFLPTR